MIGLAEYQGNRGLDNNNNASILEREATGNSRVQFTWKRNHLVLDGLLINLISIEFEFLVKFNVIW